MQDRLSNRLRLDDVRHLPVGEIMRLPAEQLASGTSSRSPRSSSAFAKTARTRPTTSRSASGCRSASTRLGQRTSVPRSRPRAR